jgi:hypothetical protein
MPIFANLTPHERAALARAADQVHGALERPWITAMNAERVEIENAPCKNDRFTAVEHDGSCLRCGAEQGEVCRS